MKKAFLLLSAAFFQFAAFAQTPAQPTITSFSDYYALNGYGEITFNLPAEDAEGNKLDTDKLFYNIYFDKEVYTFTNDYYSKVQNDMTDVPYAYSDNLDIFASGDKHDIFFYVEDYTHVGVQAVYKDGDNVYRSAVVYSDGEVDGIRQLRNEQADAISVTYTDLMGRKVDAGYHGVTLQTQIYSNGERHTVKVIK